MVKRTGPSDVNLRNLIKDLRILSKKENVKLWKRVADDLSRSTRQRRIVNISRLERYGKDGETLLVPGKVLSEGELSKKVTVAAFRFSDVARSKINAVGKTLTIRQLMKDNPKGKKVRILG
jgi:large subunit ribosomal protein L18e